MAYEKIGFNKGDVLKAEHLNHIEKALSNLMPTLTRVQIEQEEIPEDLILNPSKYYFTGVMDGKFDSKYFYFNRAMSANMPHFYYTAFDSNYINLQIAINKQSKEI